MAKAEIIEAKVNHLHSFVMSHSLGMGSRQPSEAFQEGAKLLGERLNMARADTILVRVPENRPLL
jgi:hypothetical protein